MKQCDHCEHFIFDDETEEYVCDAGGAFDEDDFARFTSSRGDSCPYFRFYDEYKIVQKQN